MLSRLLQCCIVVVMQIKLTVVADSPTWRAESEWVDLIRTWCGEFKPQMLTIAFELSCLHTHKIKLGWHKIMNYSRLRENRRFWVDLTWLRTRLNKSCKYINISSFKLHGSPITLLMHVCDVRW